MLWLAACSEALHAQPCSLDSELYEEAFTGFNRFVSCVARMPSLILRVMCMYVYVPTQIAADSRDGTACSGEVQLTSCQSLGFPHCAPALLEATQVTIAPLCAPKSHDKPVEAAAMSGFITLQEDAHVFGRTTGPWLRKWGVLAPGHLHYWHFPEDAKLTQPEVQCTCVVADMEYLVCGMRTGLN